VARPVDWARRASLASRVALLAAVAVGLSVAVVAAAAYFTVRHQLLDTLDHSLKNRAYAAAAQLNAVNELAAKGIPSWVVGAADVRISLITVDGRIATSPDRGAPLAFGRPEIDVARGAEPFSTRTISTADGDYRVAAVQSSQPGMALVLAQSLDSNHYTLEKLGFVLFVFGALGVIAAALAGWAVARNGLRPVRRLTQKAEEVARTEQLDPIDVEGNDEIARLASAFNAMLAALSASRDRQRQLVADAGHELRTPLTSLRTNLELLAQADRQGGMSSEQRDEIFDDVTAQVEELSTLVGDLVELAREEPVTSRPEPMDLSDIVARAVERVRRRAPDVTFDVSTSSWWVVGEATILERAVTNLLDNAAKYGPSDGVVTVRLEDGVLTVLDDGPGISDNDLPMVFERFWRADDARTLPGSGLGLSIVKQATERHGGHVTVTNHEPHGTLVTMVLPGQPDEIEVALGARSSQPV